MGRSACLRFDNCNEILMSAENIQLLARNVSAVPAKPKEYVGHPNTAGYYWRIRRALAKIKPVLALLKDKSLDWALPVGILLLWEISTQLHWVKPVFLPGPREVAESFYDLLVNQDLLLDFRASAIEVVLGFSLGAVLGLLTGIGAGLSHSVERFLGTTLNAFRQVPPLAWLPLLVLWIGISLFAKSVMIGKAVFFPVFLNTLQGIRGVSKKYIEVASIFEYNQALLLRRVILPAALPSIFVGLRYGAGLAWATVIVAEMLGSRVGLGFLLTRAQEMLLTAQLFVVIVIIGAVGYLVDVALRKIENNLLRWKKGFAG